MKRKPIFLLEKIFTNHRCDKGLVSRIHKNCFNSTIKRQSIQFKKWAKNFNRHFTKENTEMANKYMKRCLTL